VSNPLNSAAVYCCLKNAATNRFVCEAEKRERVMGLHVIQQWTGLFLSALRGKSSVSTLLIVSGIWGVTGVQAQTSLSAPGGGGTLVVSTTLPFSVVTLSGFNTTIGAVSGSFTYNAATNTITSWNIVLPPTIYLTQGGFHYLPQITLAPGFGQTATVSGNGRVPACQFSVLPAARPVHTCLTARLRVPRTSTLASHCPRRSSIRSTAPQITICWLNRERLLRTAVKLLGSTHRKPCRRRCGKPGPLSVPFWNLCLRAGISGCDGR